MWNSRMCIILTRVQSPAFSGGTEHNRISFLINVQQNEGLTLDEVFLWPHSG